MKTTNSTIWLLSAACVLLAALSLPAYSAQIFHDDFESESVGANPASPPWNIRVESGTASVGIRNTTVFGARTQAMEINSLGTSPNNVRVGTTMSTRGTFQTYSFDLFDQAFVNDGFFFRILTHAATDVQSASVNAIFDVGFANGSIGGVSDLYDIGQAQHIDIVANSGSTSVSYLGGAQTIDPFSADIWVDGQLALTDFAARNTGVMGGMGFHVANSAQQVLLVDNVMKFQGADVQVSHPAGLLLLMLATVGLIARSFHGGNWHQLRKLHPLALLVTLFTASAVPSHATTLTFQQGDQGAFSETDAAYVQIQNPDTNYGSHPGLFAEGDPAGSSAGRYFLIGFFDLIGSNAGQVTPGSNIVSATLTIRVAGNSSAGTSTAHRVLQAWDEDTITHNSFSSGAMGPLAGVDYLSDPLASFVPSDTNALVQLDITSVVQQWSSGLSNHGLVFFNSSFDGWNAHGDDVSIRGLRPLLEVEFAEAVPAPGALSIALIFLSLALGKRHRKTSRM